MIHDIIYFVLGVYKDYESYPLYIEIGQVYEFRSITTGTNSVEFGASVTLNEMVKYFKQYSSSSVTFEPMSSCIAKVASNPVRNVSKPYVTVLFCFFLKFVRMLLKYNR